MTGGKTFVGQLLSFNNREKNEELLYFQLCTKKMQVLYTATIEMNKSTLSISIRDSKQWNRMIGTVVVKSKQQKNTNYWICIYWLLRLLLQLGKGRPLKNANRLHTQLRFFSFHFQSTARRPESHLVLPLRPREDS